MSVAMTRAQARALPAFVCMLMLAVLLSACASGRSDSREPSRSSRSPVTESPEPMPVTVAPATARAQARLALAAAYFEHNRLDIALEEIDQALVHDARSADAYSMRGLVHSRMKSYAQAELDFRQALTVDARHADAMHNLGWMMCQMGSREQGQAWFSRALDEPGYRRAGRTFMARGVCHAQDGDRDAAAAALTRAVILMPDDPVAAYHLADVLHRQGKSADARVYLRRINDSDQADARSLLLGIELEQVLGSPMAAERLAVRLRSRYPEAADRLAEQNGRF